MLALIDFYEIFIVALLKNNPITKSMSLMPTNGAIIPPNP